MTEELELLKKKILYRSSYRGTKELDILLSTFVKKYINHLNDIQLKALEDFLEYDDETILNFYNYNIKNENIDKNAISSIFKQFKI